VLGERRAVRLGHIQDPFATSKIHRSFGAKNAPQDDKMGKQRQSRYIESLFFMRVPVVNGKGFLNGSQFWEFDL
jgi:hypothetical protein